MRLSKRKLSKKRVKSRKSRKQKNHSKKRLRKQISKRYSRKKKNKLTKRRNKKGGVNLGNIIYKLDKGDLIVNFRGLYRKPNNEHGDKIEKNTCYFNSTINFLLASNFLRTIIKEKQEYIQGDNYLKDFFKKYFDKTYQDKISAANFKEEGKSKNLIKWKDESGEKFHEGESGTVSNIYEYLFDNYFPLFPNENTCIAISTISGDEPIIYEAQNLKSMKLYKFFPIQEEKILNNKSNIIDINYRCKKRPLFLIIEAGSPEVFTEIKKQDSLELKYELKDNNQHIKKDKYDKYILKSIILHIDSNHFTCFVRHYKDNIEDEWIYIDDMKVDTFKNYKENDEKKSSSEQKYMNYSNEDEYIKKYAMCFLYEREDLVENDPNSEANINKELSENFIKSKTCRGQK